MKYLVTGGAGFIGSHLVDFLIAEGHEVCVIDNLSSSNAKRNAVNRKAVFQNASVTDPGALMSIAGNVDGIFHLAAIPRVVRSVEEPEETHHANVNGFMSVLLHAKKLGVKMVFASSSSVYGKQDDYNMVETMSKHPLSPYALHKVINEQYAEMFARIYDMKLVGLRYFNVYGPRQSTKGGYALVVGKFLEQLSNGEKMTIYGEGNQTRDYTFVTDIVRGTYLAMQTELVNNYEAFNLGTGAETSVNEIAEMIGGEVEHIIPNPRGEYEEDRKRAVNDKAREMLGWVPKVDIKSGIEIVKGLHKLRDELVPKDTMMFSKDFKETF